MASVQEHTFADCLTYTTAKCCAGASAAAPADDSPIWFVLDASGCVPLAAAVTPCIFGGTKLHLTALPAVSFMAAQCASETSMHPRLVSYTELATKRLRTTSACELRRAGSDEHVACALTLAQQCETRFRVWYKSNLLHL